MIVDDSSERRRYDCDDLSCLVAFDGVVDAAPLLPWMPAAADPIDFEGVAIANAGEAAFEAADPTDAPLPPTTLLPLPPPLNSKILFKLVFFPKLLYTSTLYSNNT